MAHPYMDGRLSVTQTNAVITHFYTAKAWIEDRAEDQLQQVASWPDHLQVAPPEVAGADSEAMVAQRWGIIITLNELNRTIRNNV